MGRLRAVFVVVVGCVVLCPAVARAQATLAGVVQDPSGAVLPGVNVEVRGSASYTVPKVDVLVSSIIRITPAPAIFSANYLVPNLTVAEQLGHLPAGGTSAGNQTVNLIDTNQLYADEGYSLVDMRFAKVFRFGGTRFDIGADVYNLFNSNTATAYDGNYDAVPAAGLGPGGEWLRPTSIVQPRFVRLNVTVNF